MRVVVGLGLVTVVVAGALVACGGGSDAAATSATTTAGSGGGGGATTTSGPTAEQACAAVAKAWCERLDACTSGHGVAVRFGDQATCEARRALGCVAALSAPETANTPANVAECADHLPDELCTDLLVDALTGPCKAPEGPRADGAPCGVGAQCASAHCAIPRGAACGACAPAPVAGDSCAATGVCGGGLHCGATSQLCAPLAGVDAPCDGDDQPCDRGLSCVGVTDATPKGTCQPAAQAAGMPCDPTGETGAGCSREAGLFCDPTTSQCVEVTFVAPGAPCGAVAAGAWAACLDGSACDRAAGEAKGTCVAAPADGAACDTATGPGCVAPARCLGAAVDGGVTGTCTLVDPASCG